MLIPTKWQQSLNLTVNNLLPFSHKPCVPWHADLGEERLLLDALCVIAAPVTTVLRALSSVNQRAAGLRPGDLTLTAPGAPYQLHLTIRKASLHLRHLKLWSAQLHSIQEVGCKGCQHVMLGL